MIYINKYHEIVETYGFLQIYVSEIYHINYYKAGVPELV